MDVVHFAFRTLGEGTMKRFVPVPGDLIIVEFSEWYALRDGEKLRVCENCEWIDVGEELYVAPRSQVNTFWGPDYGQPDGRSPEVMSTSGGPFTTIKIKDLDGLKLVGEETDTFWCWVDRPRAKGGMDRHITVAVWTLPILPDSHYRELMKHGCPTHRDRVETTSSDGEVKS